MQAKPSRKKNNSSKIIVDQYDHMLAHSKMYHPKNEPFIQTPLQYTMDPKAKQLYDQSSQSEYSLQQNFKQQQEVCRNCGQSFPSRIYVSHLNVCQLELKRFSSLNFSKKPNKESNSNLHYEGTNRHNDYEICGSNSKKESLNKNNQKKKSKQKDIQYDKQIKNLKKTYSKKQDLYDQDMFGSSKYLKRPNSSNKNKIILTKGYENMKEKILTKLQSKQKTKGKYQKLQTFNSICIKSPPKIKSSLSKQKDQRQSVQNSRYKKIASNRDSNLKKVKNQKLNLNNEYIQFNRSDIYGNSKQKNQRAIKIPSTQEAISKLRLKDIKQLKEANHKNQLKKKNITLHQMNNSIRNIPEREQQKVQPKNQRKAQKKQKQIKNTNYNQKLQSHYRLGKNKQQYQKFTEKVILGQRQKQYEQERGKRQNQYEQKINKDQVQRQYYPNSKKSNTSYQLKKQEKQSKNRQQQKPKRSQKKQQTYLQESQNYLQNQVLNRNNVQSGNRRHVRSPPSNRNVNLGNRQNQRIRTENRNRQNNTNTNNLNQQRPNRNHARRQSSRQQQNAHSRQNAEEGQRQRSHNQRQRRTQQNSNRRRANQSGQNNPVHRNNTFNFISQTLTDQFQMMNEHFNLMNNIFSNFNNFVNVNINTNQPTSFVFRSGPNNIRVRRRNREYQNNESSSDSQDSDSSYTSSFVDSQEEDQNFYYENEEEGQNGMTQHQISSIPILKYSKHHHGHNQCTICLVQFTQSQIFKKLFCEHMFHVDCIDEWLRRKSDCPVCRDKMGTD